MSTRAGLIVAPALGSLALVCMSVWHAPQALAADPQLRLPLFDSLQRVATESVNVTISRWPLGIVSWALDHSEDPGDRDLHDVVRGLKSIQIRSVKFDSDRQYDLSIIDDLRNQLSAPGWSPLLQVHQHGDRADNVDIYVSTSHNIVNGLAIVASGPRELTIVNIVGSVDPAKLAKVSSRLGLPDLPM